MTELELPREVLSLIARSLPSMVHIELLLLLRRTAPLAWTVTDTAMELRSSPALVETAFADLRAARLAELVPSSEPPAHRFDPSDDATVRAVALLQDCYDRRPVTLIKALYKRPPSAVQAFADAFRLRSEERKND